MKKKMREMVYKKSGETTMKEYNHKHKNMLFYLFGKKMQVDTLKKLRSVLYWLQKNVINIVKERWKNQLL